MVIFRVRNAKITILPFNDDEIELNSTMDIVIDQETIKQLLSDQLFININLVREFCSHFQSYTTLNTPQENARIEMAFKLLPQLLKTDVLDNLITKEKDND